MKRSEPILIVGTNWIGDSVMSLAALREIRRLFPEAPLSLLVRPWVAGVFRNQGLVDQLLVEAPASGTLGAVMAAAGRIRGHRTAILFPNSFRAALTARLARIPKRVGYETDGRSLLLSHRARPRIQELHRHQIFYYLDLLFQTGLSPRDYLNDPGFDPDTRLRAPAEGIAAARLLLEEHRIGSGDPLVLLNPGASYGPAKQWPVQRFAELADRLIAAEGVRVAIVGSAGEVPLARSLAGAMRHSPALLTGKTDLDSLMGLLSLARLFVTNDSGPMHLAAALDTPQIALFGSTDEVATGPHSSRARVLHKHVECSPCLLRECPIDLRCFTRIEVDEVYESARAVLHRHV